MYFPIFLFHFCFFSWYNSNHFSSDARITKLETENEALRTHLRLALSTIKDPIPETLYLPPSEEESFVTMADEDWGFDAEGREDVWESEEWDDCWGVLLREAE